MEVEGCCVPAIFEKEFNHLRMASEYGTFHCCESAREEMSKSQCDKQQREGESKRERKRTMKKRVNEKERERKREREKERKRVKERESE